MHLFDMMDYLLREVKLVMVRLVMISWSQRINGRLIKYQIQKIQDT